MKPHKILEKLHSSSKNVSFRDMVKLVEAFGFAFSRTKGSHQIFVHPDFKEPVNLQEVNGQAKPYQVKQFLKLVEKYNLELKDGG